MQHCDNSDNMNLIISACRHPGLQLYNDIADTLVKMCTVVDLEEKNYIHILESLKQAFAESENINEKNIFSFKEKIKRIPKLQSAYTKLYPENSNTNIGIEQADETDL